MESFRALNASREAAAFRHCTLTMDQVFQLKGRLSNLPTCVYALKRRELEQLAVQVGGTIHDRGGKSRPKPLAYYLRHRQGLVRVRTGYRNPGQAERGIRALLASRDIPRQNAAYFLGVEDDLFEQLWQRAIPNGPANISRAKIEAFVLSDELRLMLDQNPRLKVPEKLIEKFVGKSTAADAVRKRILLAAEGSYPVLIEGETGTGKEVVARAIHDFSTRVSDSFMPFNCGGVPSDLFESELFGHQKGAFTGALRNKAGLLTSANAGTLFLDEIGDLSPLHQVKVLRVLEDGRYRPVGGLKEIKSHARIIAATNRNLQQMVQAGTFREDLFYRLFNLRIRTPALREHPADIPDLALHFWTRLAEKKAPPLPAEVLRKLTTYNWPGNARELRSFLTNLAVLADGRTATVEMFRAVMRDRLGPIFSPGDDR